MGMLRNAAQAVGLIEPSAPLIRESSGGAQAPGGVIVPPPRPTGLTVTVDTALSLPAVYRSVQIIQTSVATMGMEVFRGADRIDIPSIIRRPNVDDGPEAFVEETTASLAMHGEAFWRVYRPEGSPYASVANLQVLDPSTVVVEAVLDRDGLDTGRRRYLLAGRVVPPSTIKHLKLMRRPGKVHGLGPVQAGTAELTFALRLRDFISGWFDINPPPGYLTTDLVLGPNESAEYAEAWKTFLREHGIPVLSNGLKYETLHLSPSDAMYADVQRLVITSIARLFGIPAQMLLAEIEGSSMTYTNVEQENLTFLQRTLARYCNEIENAFTDLLPRGQSVKFREEDLLRLDHKTLWEVRGIQVAMGYSSAAELRRLDGKTPLPRSEVPGAGAPLAPAPGGSDEAKPQEAAAA